MAEMLLLFSSLADAAGCVGCHSVYPFPANSNGSVCSWFSASAACKISIRPQCGGTEFTAKKHGGEKGIPFRLQVDSYRLSDVSGYEPEFISSLACQVKVFKTKGADRKNRTDQNKIDSKTPTEPVRQTPFFPTRIAESKPN